MTLALTILAAWLTACALATLGFILRGELRWRQARPQGRVLDFTRARVGDRR